MEGRKFISIVRIIDSTKITILMETAIFYKYFNGKTFTDSREPGSKYFNGKTFTDSREPELILTYCFQTQAIAA